MKEFLSIVVIILFSSNYSVAQIGRLALSPAQKIEQQIAKTNITIEYSRPSKRDRNIFGGLVPYDTYWRTGANQNTTIEFSQDVILADTRIKKGKYAIITKPGINNWEFLLYKETNNWDVPKEIDPEKIVCKTTLSPTRNNPVKQSLLISIGDFTNYSFDLLIEWDEIKLAVPFKLTTQELMAAVIKDELEGPTAGDFYSAAVYQLESEKDYTQGIEWIDKAINLRADKVWYDYWVKARLMVISNNSNGIKQVIDKGIELAKAKENSFGINEFEAIRKKISE